MRDALKVKISTHFDNILKLTEIAKYEKEIYYFIVDSPENVRKLTSQKTNGIAYPSSQTVVVFHQQNSSAVSEHELYHVISIDSWGKSADWLQEGTAVDADKIWWNYPLHNLCNYLKSKNLLIPIPNLIKSFRKENTMISYPQMGSFTQYLIKKYGLSNLKELWKIQNFNMVYNKSIEELEKEWLLEISKYSATNIVYNP